MFLPRSANLRVRPQIVINAIVIACIITATALVMSLQTVRDKPRPTDSNAAKALERVFISAPHVGVLHAVEIVLRYPGSREAESAGHFINQNITRLSYRDFERLTGRHVPILPEDDFPVGLVQKAVRGSLVTRGVAEF